MERTVVSATAEPEGMNFTPSTGQLLVTLEDRIQNVSQEEIRALAQRHKGQIGQDIQGLNPRFPEEGIFRLMSETYDVMSGVRTFVLGLTTGTMAKALQNVYHDQDENPIAVQGLLVTNDNKIVLGVRARPASRGVEPYDFKIMLAPAGYATYNTNRGRWLESEFFSELEEELGLKERDISSFRMLGHHRDAGFTNGTRITYLVGTNRTFEQVKERRGKDKWEYVELVGLDNTPISVREFLSAKDFSKYSRHANGILEQSVRPPLTYYVAVLSGVR